MPWSLELSGRCQRNACTMALLGWEEGVGCAAVGGVAVGHQWQGGMMEAAGVPLHCLG